MVKINGATSVVGLLGNPVAHSLSPAMHNAAFAYLKLNWTYVPFLVEPERLPEAIAGLKALSVRGVNVTVPLKQRVIRHIDQLTEDAAKIGAVNTIFMRDDGSTLGDNTDWIGFLKHLDELGVSPANNAFILGSGGAARAIIYALHKRNFHITVVSRNISKAATVITELASSLSIGNLDLVDQKELSALDHADLIVNTTPVGMSPLPDLSPWSAQVPLPKCELVYDLIYNPAKTKFMKQAEDCNIRAVNGLRMLTYQAAQSFEIWTGVKAPVDIMMRAAEHDTISHSG